MKIGIIGFDTSHVTAFTDLINNPKNPYHVLGGKVVAGFPGGSSDIPLSINRLPGFQKELVEKYNIQVYPSIEELLPKVDAILLESVDGRVHLKQFKQVAAAKKPVFIDKPFTVNAAEVKDIKELARKANVPVFSSSSLRYDINIQKECQDKSGGIIIGVEAYGSAKYDPPQPGLFWYGIHSAEILFAAMGKGCKSVSCIGNDKSDVVVGRWEGGRIGVLRGIRQGYEEFGCLFYREKIIKDVKASSNVPSYAGLVKEIIRFFETRNPPVSLEETVEIISFIEAANLSKNQQGKEITI